ncbi:adenylate/guanylate cyclase domain-containing protein [Hydrogenophaga sp. 5NK40-0174]|uniref:CHASE2 domain-containing protein n=1 Tax=Hydrogenophaga sp. 5NK40-0174 TaxID=3127649 RepID=UPI003106E0B5
MRIAGKQGTRWLLSCLPLAVVLAMLLGWLPDEPVRRLDHFIYDLRLRLHQAPEPDARVVIVDIDEASLATLGQWPWPRDRMAHLVDQLFDRYGIAVLGLDTVLAEPDRSSGFERLAQLAGKELAAYPEFVQQVRSLRPVLDHDGRLARALRNRPVVLGYYFSSEGVSHQSGVLPPPVIQAGAGESFRATQWTGYGANLPMLARSAAQSGFFNSVTDADGVVRSLPLLASFDGHYYESLALAMYRQVLGMPDVDVVPAPGGLTIGGHRVVSAVRLRQAGDTTDIPVDDWASVLVPFPGRGGPEGGSFHYVSAAQVLNGDVPQAMLRDKIVLLGSTAPGLLDLRTTPVGRVYPGVETHASLLAGLLDGRIKSRPDYAAGYELLTVVLVGLMLGLVLPVLNAQRGMALGLSVVVALVGLTIWMYEANDLVVPLAASLLVALTSLALNMSHGYLFESRAKRELAEIFRSYVPPELVRKMVRDPQRYSMEAKSRELTVLFCDMRGFTRLSESMAPMALQSLLNDVFSRLTRCIRDGQGTIDKYMGDCIMAFWGAPVTLEDHARRAVSSALAMVEAIRQFNAEHPEKEPLGVGIGLNTGEMSVGDMGSDVRRSYTVIGDSVNLASRLEALTRVYDVDIIASEFTRAQAPGFTWQELDKVKVKGKDQAVTIYAPLAAEAASEPALAQELLVWEQFLMAWRRGDWYACEQHIRVLQQHNGQKGLYRLYAQRLASMREVPAQDNWDGTSVFETK